MAMPLSYLLSRRVLVWLLLSLSALLLPRQLRAAEGQEYVDKKAGFRLQVPAGWEKQKASGVTVAFRGPKSGVSVIAEVAEASPEEYLAADKENFRRNLPSWRQISEEEAVVGGFPSRKLVFVGEQNNVAVRMWAFVVLSKGEYWTLTVVAPDRPAGSPEEVEVLGVVASFEFLEPTLSRVKAGVPPYLTASLPRPDAKARYFVNDAVGMKILLPPGWQIGQEQEASYGKPRSEERRVGKECRL